MSYFIDDDASQVREIKDKLEKLQSDFLSNQFSVQQENVESGQSIFPGANPSARGGGGSSGGGGISLPINITITDSSDTWTGTQTLNLGTGDGHVFKWTVDQDLTFASAVSSIPASGTQRTFELEFVHDGVGGTFTVTLPNNFVDENGNTLASFDISANTVLLSCRVNDGTNFLVVQKNVTAVSGGGATLPLTPDNDQIAISWKNVADDGQLELKVDSGDFFDFTESNNGPVSLNIRAQHAVDPDNAITITQFPGASGVGTFFAPNQMQFLGSGSSNVFNYDQNRIVTNVNILPDADGTLSIGAVASRYLDMYSAGYKFDINRGLNWNTGGGNIIVNGASDTFTITVDSVLKQTMSATLTTLAGNVNILGDLDIGDRLQLEEITAPGGDPPSNSGWFYGKVVSGHTEPFWEDENGTVTNLIGGAGGSVQSISQGNTDVTVADAGAGTIIGTVDGIQKFNISSSIFAVDQSITLGLLGSHDIIFNASMASTLDVKTDGVFDIGDSTHALNDVHSEAFTIRGSGTKVASTSRFITADSSNVILHTVAGDGFRFESAAGSITEILSSGGILPKGDVKFDFGDTVDYNESQSGVGSAGFATALPANPTGYIVVKQGGTEVVVPYYDKS